MYEYVLCCTYRVKMFMTGIVLIYEMSFIIHHVILFIPHIYAYVIYYNFQIYHLL